MDRVEGRPGPGDTVEVRDAAGTSLARGAYSPDSQIRVRVWSFDPDAEIGPGWIAVRIAAAVEARGDAATAPGRACRLVFAESDGLPGLVVDRYADVVVCQFLSAGAERWREAVVAALDGLLAPAGVYERSDTGAREKEGLSPRTGRLSGRDPPDAVEIVEPTPAGDLRFLVDVRHGHKTGFYLDQRENRGRVAEAAEGREVLEAFCYTGAFGVAALRGGASGLVQIDASADALEVAARHRRLNGADRVPVDALQGDAFALLRRLREEGRRFDLVVLDPPKFAESRARVDAAARGYKDINLQAFHLLRPGGLLFTFSCSGHVPPDLFQKIVADAALDAGRNARIVRWLDQAPDHPVALPFPEGRYLKGLLCRAD